jgi:hypothetical protein
MPFVPNTGGGSAGSGITDAPSDGSTYGRQNGAWEVITAGADYVHTQAIAATTWTVQHNLGQKPVTVITLGTDGDDIVGDIDWAASTINMVIIDFSVPVAGTAYIRY